MDKIIVIEDVNVKFVPKNKKEYIINYIHPDFIKYRDDENLIIHHYVNDVIEDVLIGINRYVGNINYINKDVVSFIASDIKFYSIDDTTSLRSDKINILLQKNI